MDLSNINHVTQALLATLFTWGLTALGAGMVFWFKDISRKVLNAMVGFAAGVMIAASFWSLLAPAIEMGTSAGFDKAWAWVPAAIGFLAGGLFLYAVDKLLPHMHLVESKKGSKSGKAEGIKTSWHRSVLLVFAITLHNIPEGLAVGVAFGAVAAGVPEASLAGAIALAIGMGIQNFPEGAAVSIPLRKEGYSRTKSFLYGQASGIVEPISGVIGAVAAVAMQSLLPYALAFAAGAMIFVVAEDLIPEIHMGGEDTDIATVGLLVGFVVMMILDVALG